MWSQRNNNNYQQTGLLTALSYYAGNNKLFLKNFYLKAKRSVLEAEDRGPGGLRLPRRRSAARRAGGAAARAADAALRDLARHRAVHRDAARPRRSRRASGGDEGRSDAAEAGADQKAEKPAPEDAAVPGRQLHRPHGPALQPHRRRAARLPVLEPERSAEDARTTTPAGRSASCSTCRWCASPDAKVLDAAMEPVEGRRCRRRAASTGTGAVFVVNHDADPSAARAPLPAEGRGVRGGRGAVRGGGPEVQPRLVHHQGRRPPTSRRRPPSSACRSYARRRGADGEDAPDQGAAHRLRPHAGWAPRTRAGGGWSSTSCRIPYDYISTQTVARTADLNAKYDVILFPPVGRGGAAGRRGHADVGQPAAVEEDRAHAEHRRRGLDRRHAARASGGRASRTSRTSSATAALLITADDTSDLAVDLRPDARACRCTRSQRLKAPGTVVRSKFVDLRQPDRLRLRREPVDLHVERPRLRRQQHARRAGARAASAPTAASGRRAAARRTIPTCRRAGPFVEPPGGAEGRSRGRRCRSPTSRCATGSTSSPSKQRPRVILRYGDARDLLVSGLLEGGTDIAQRPAVDRRAARQGARRALLATTPSGAARRRAATSWCSTRS